MIYHFNEFIGKLETGDDSDFKIFVGDFYLPKEMAYYAMKGNLICRKILRMI